MQLVDVFVEEMFRRYIDFDGRTTLNNFWIVFLDSFIITAIYLVLFWLTGKNGFISMIWNVIGLALFIPSIAISVRRMHDIGKSGWWVLITVIPIIGTIWFLVLAGQRGK